MYTPPAFREFDPDELSRLMLEVWLSTLVTAIRDRVMAPSLPLILEETEGAQGVLYGHLAQANLSVSDCI